MSLYQLGIFLILLLPSIAFSQASKSSPAQRTRVGAASGRSTFNSSCAGCHGLDGGGSDKAVNISTSARVQKFTDSELAGIIRNGVTGTGMPAFHILSDAQVRAIVRYVRSLQGKGEASTISGDAKRGKEIFFGKADCSSCHTVSGKGGFIGPDLTNHGATSSANALRDEIIKSPRVPTSGYRSAVLTTAKGDRFEGIVRNEDNFSVQLQGRDGSFHFVKKTELQSLEYSSVSLMPTNYRERLSESELNDLVSYLMSTPDPGRKAVLRQQEDDFE